jgi:hypothetical protein
MIRRSAFSLCVLFSCSEFRGETGRSSAESRIFSTRSSIQSEITPKIYHGPGCDRTHGHGEFS